MREPVDSAVEILRIYGPRERPIGRARQAPFGQVARAPLASP